MTRYTQDFFAYFGGKQVYKATGAYFSKEEGRAQAKQIYGQLAKTNSYGYLLVCVVSKYPTECWDGKTFGAQPPPPEPKCPPGQVMKDGKCQPVLPAPGTKCPPGQTLKDGKCVPVLPMGACPPGTMLFKTNPADPGKCMPVLPPPTHPQRKPSNLEPLVAKLPPKISQVRGVGAMSPFLMRHEQAAVQWVGDVGATRTSRPSTQCPPGYKYSSRWHVCVPAGKGDPLLHGLGLTQIDVATAKGILYCWGLGAGKNSVTLTDYGPTDAYNPIWSSRDGVMLFAFRTWWNKGNNSPKLFSGSGTVLDEEHYAALLTQVTKLTPGGCLQDACPQGQWLNPTTGKCEPVPVAPGGGQAQPQPGGGAAPPIFSPSAPQTVTPGAETAPPPAAPSGGGGGVVTPPPGGETAITKPAPAKSEIPWGWIIGGVALAGVAGLAIWAGAKGVGGAMGSGARDNPVNLPSGYKMTRGQAPNGRVGWVVSTRGGWWVIGDGFISGNSPEVFRTQEAARRAAWKVFRRHGLPEHVTAKNNPTPAKNIYWKDIKPGDKVELRGHVYVVTKPNGKKFTAYWMSHGGEDREAQRWLDWAAKGRVKARRART